MAAGPFTWYTRALRNMAQGNIDYLNDVIKAYPVSDGYTPGTSSNSIWGQVSGFQTSASTTVVAAITFASKELTISGSTNVKFVAANLDAFSSSAGTMNSFKYLVIVDSSVSNSASVSLSYLLGFIDMDTAASDASVGDSTNVTVTWPAAGVAKLEGNP
jgi:hypothetical protein